MRKSKRSGPLNCCKVATLLQTQIVVSRSACAECRCIITEIMRESLNLILCCYHWKTFIKIWYFKKRWKYMNCEYTEGGAAGAQLRLAVPPRWGGGAALRRAPPQFKPCMHASVILPNPSEFNLSARGRDREVYMQRGYPQGHNMWTRLSTAQSAHLVLIFAFSLWLKRIPDWDCSAVISSRGWSSYILLKIRLCNLILHLYQPVVLNIGYTT